MSEINDKYGEYIDLCTAHFKRLLESELSRCERMKSSPPPTACCRGRFFHIPFYAKNRCFLRAA